MAGPVRILLCDDHPIVREALRSRLEQLEGFEIAGEADDGIVAVARVRELDPDLLLIDVEMPRLDGITATRRILGLKPAVRVIVFSAHDGRDMVTLARESGAHGYLRKSASPEETRDAVKAVAGGGSWFPAGVPEPGETCESVRLMALSPREREVLSLYASGLRAEGVAAELGISTATVYTHVRNAVARLGVSNRSQAIAVATRYNFLTPVSGSGKTGSGAQEDSG